MPVELVVFDWDGTLIDSTGRIADCLAHAAEATGLPLLSHQRYRSIIGLGLPEALAELYPDTNLQTRSTLRQHYAERYIALEKDPCLPYEGAIALLDALKARGMKLAVATGKNRPGLVRAFSSTQLGHYFDISRTADETASKPDPRMLFEIINELGITQSSALMVGDTGFDLEMASRAGIAAVGVTHGAHGVDELSRHNPLALVDHLDHILAMIDSPHVTTFHSRSSLPGKIHE